MVTHENGDRYYTTPIGVLPSVTTVLSQVGDKTGLVKWKERIGDDAANQIIRQSRHRGNAVHGICEDYLLNKEDWKKAAATDLETFSHIRSHLDQHVKTVYGIELPVWSKELQCAGRTDGIIQWDDFNAILDFKTAGQWNAGKGSKEKMTKYMLQTTVYAVAVEELYNISVPKSVIIVMVDHDRPRIKVFNNQIVRDSVREIFINRG